MKYFNNPKAHMISAVALTLLVALPSMATAGEKALLRVNGKPLTENDVRFAESEIGPQLASVPEAERRRVLIEYLIENTLLADAGAKAGLAQGGTFGERLAYYRRRAIRDAYFDKSVTATVKEADAKALYDRQIGSVPVKEEIRASHILVKTEADANDVVERLNRGGDFAEIAKEKSIGPSKTQGGDLGYFSRGQMVAKFEKVAFGLKKGEVSEPVKTQFGWHVIKLADRRKKEPPKYEALKDRIMASLIQRKAQEVMQGLRKSAKVEFVDKGLEKELKEVARGSFNLE